MKRLPTKIEMLNAFFATLALIHTWAMVIFLYNIPGLIKQLTVGELFSVFSYIMVSALFECGVIFIVLLGLSIVLPEKWLRSDFAVRSALILLLGEVYILPFHLYIPRLSTLMFEAGVTTFITMWTVLFIAELVLVSMIVSQYPRFTSKVRDVIDRITVLGGFYLFLDVIGLITVIIVNWS